MIRYSTLLLSLTVILFASCQQDIDEVLGDDPTPPPPPPAVFDTLVTRMYYLENLAPFIGDTTGVIDFAYDSRQRMTSYKITYPTDPGYTNIEYVYQGIDIHPVKRNHYSVSSFGIVSKDTTFFRWANGKVSWDSIRVHNDNQVLGYVQVNSYSTVGAVVTQKITQYVYYNAPDPRETYNSTVTVGLKFENEDITDEEIDIISDSQSGPTRYTKHQYIQKPNPLFRCTIEYPYLSAGYELFSAQRHLPVARDSWQFISNPGSQTRHSYSLRSDGYPLTDTIREVIGSDNYSNIFLYSYSK